jgi:rRNA maturation endonuclease Nob1
MKLPISKWSLHCTNPTCGYAFENSGTERDVICKRCGGFVEITEQINFIETEDKEE